MSKFKFPTAYTVLMGLIAFIALLTWIIPAGTYQMEYNSTVDRDVPIKNTYQTIEELRDTALTELKRKYPNPEALSEDERATYQEELAAVPSESPQTVSDILNAPYYGFEGAIDVCLFVLFIGGFLGIVNATGAIDAGIARATKKMEGKEIIMIPILMALFAAGGTIYGMAEETIPFYTILIPVVIAAGFDAVTAVAIILLGAGIGTLGSTINPFATVIASNAAGINFLDGIYVRLIILAAGWLLCVGYVMRYAKMVKANPSKSLVSNMTEENKAHFLGNKSSDQFGNFTTAHKLILLVFVAAFGIMIYGVSTLGWWMAEMSTLFLTAGLIIALIARMGEKDIADNFVAGAGDLLGVALVIGIARGIVIVMDAGQITHTILNYFEGMLADTSAIIFVNLMFFIEVILSFLVPSSSGLAVLTMPIMAPLAEFSQVPTHLVVTAYQSASGLVNLITPTSGVVMGGLAIGRVSYGKWVKFVVPLMAMLTVLIVIVLSVGTML